MIPPLTSLPGGSQHRLPHPQHPWCFPWRWWLGLCVRKTPSYCWIEDRPRMIQLNDAWNIPSPKVLAYFELLKGDGSRGNAQLDVQKFSQVPPEHVSHGTVALRIHATWRSHPPGSVSLCITLYLILLPLFPINYALYRFCPRGYPWYFNLGLGPFNIIIS